MHQKPSSHSCSLTGSLICLHSADILHFTSQFSVPIGSLIYQVRLPFTRWISMVYCKRWLWQCDVITNRKLIIKKKTILPSHQIGFN